ncbi:XRE family transcriptional regulator [Lactiplantibacillus plantarum]|nr:XRE family transcriptional regulator [Lactiplantibacillus plantarum]
MKTRIGELRREHGLTLKQLGQKIHVKDNALSQYETGKRNPQLGLLVEIAKFFKVSLEYLICESDKRDYSIASDQEAINLLQLLDNRKVIFDNLSNETALRLAVWIENHNELLSSEYPELLKTAKWFTYETIDEADILQHHLTNFRHYTPFDTN